VTPALLERAHAIGAIEVLAKPLAAHDIARALAAAVGAAPPDPGGLQLDPNNTMLAGNDAAAPLQ
jgi:hypothetical protein